MTSKERIIAALNGEPVDRIPFSPFLVNSDSCPPGVIVEKFKLVADVAKAYSTGN